MPTTATKREVRYFIELSDWQRELTRLYCLLSVYGPLTLAEICGMTNWTRTRANKALYALRLEGSVRLIERGQHGVSGHRCGKWQALEEGAEMRQQSA